MKNAAVLIIEEETEFLRKLKQILHEKKITVEYASTGKEALKKIKQHKYATVILDILTHKPDGMTTIRHIRKIKKDMPIVVLTKLSHREDIEHIQSMGVRECRVSPHTTPRKFATLIYNIIKNNE